MSAPTRYLPFSATSTSIPPPPPIRVGSDFVVILAALLCALLCVVGLITVVRCAWIRRYTGGRGLPPYPQFPANKGLKKKIIQSLPKSRYNQEDHQALEDCAICLTEFAEGDEIRVLPQCGHGFHVSCIDTWLASRASCPSCRRLMVVGVCKKCGGVPESGADRARAGIEGREDDVNRFLP